MKSWENKARIKIVEKWSKDKKSWEKWSENGKSVRKWRQNIKFQGNKLRMKNPRKN